MAQIYTDRFKYKKPELDLYLGEYNDLLASILVDRHCSFKYFTSATLNRVEAQTHFYESVEKFIQISQFLNGAADASVVVAEADKLLYHPLKQQFGDRVVYAGNSLNHDKKYFKYRFVRSFISTFLLSLIAKLISRVDEKYDDVIRTFFDHRSIGSNGRIRDEYFGDFLEDLRANSRVLVVYKLLKVRDLRNFIKKRNGIGFHTCLLEYFIGPLGVLKAFYRFFRERVDHKGEVSYRGIDISGMLNASMAEDYYLMRNLPPYLEYYAAKSILKRRLGRIYYPFENQTWEKMYPLVRFQLGCKQTRIVGYQHTGLSYKLLNYFPTEIESSQPVYPDLIVTVGKLIQRVLIEKANFPAQIKVGGALRHTKYMKGGEFEIRKPSLEIYGRIAYAFSNDLQKYGRILNILKDIFGNTNITVYLKFHPDHDEKLILRNYKSSFSKNMIPTKDPWPVIYASVDAILYDDNTIGIEGMLNGVKTYEFEEADTIYNCDRLFRFDEWNYQLDRNGVCALRDSILDHTIDKDYDVDYVRRYISDYFLAYSKDRSIQVFTGN